jgi:hypothetical protein
VPPNRPPATARVACCTGHSPLQRLPGATWHAVCAFVVLCCAARDALRCTRRTDLAALVRAAHDSDRVGTRPLHSQLSRCAGTPRGGPRVRCCSARPTCTRPDPRCSKARPGAPRCSLPGRRRLWHAGGSQPPWRWVLQASWCSDPPMTSKRRPRPWCSTLPVPKVPGPAGRPDCRRKGGAPRRRHGQSPAPQGACWKAPCRPGPSSATAGPGSAGPGGCLGREAPALARPDCPAASLVARSSLQPPCCGDGGGFRVSPIILLLRPYREKVLRNLTLAAGSSAG